MLPKFQIGQYSREAPMIKTTIRGSFTVKRHAMGRTMSSRNPKSELKRPQYYKMETQSNTPFGYSLSPTSHAPLVATEHTCLKLFVPRRLALSGADSRNECVDRPRMRHFTATHRRHVAKRLYANCGSPFTNLRVYHQTHSRSIPSRIEKNSNLDAPKNRKKVRILKANKQNQNPPLRLAVMRHIGSGANHRHQRTEAPWYGAGDESKLGSESPGQKIKKNEDITELQEQEIDMIRKMVEASITSMPSTPINAAREIARTPAGAMSILDELFPQELNQRFQKGDLTRHIPRASIQAADLAVKGSFHNLYRDEYVNDVKVQTQQTGTRNDDFSVRRIPWAGDSGNTKAILVLQKASKHLVKGDFRQIASSGKHIEGWSDAPTFTHIICARDLKSLQRTGDYILVFPDRHAAQDYCDQTSRLHRHSKTFSRQHLNRPISPRPELRKEDNVIWKDSLCQYTLKLPSHNLSLRISEAPFRPLLMRIVHQSGYPELVGGRKSDFEVLLWLDSLRTFPLSVIRTALARDGKERGSAWSVSTFDQKRVRMLDDSLISHFRTSGLNIRNASTDMSRESQGATSERVIQHRPRYFVLSFLSEEEAERFVFTWHRRDLTTLVQDLVPVGRSERIIANSENMF